MKTMSDDASVFPPMMQAAVAIHEAFLAYVDAGFTRDEALRIVVTQMSWFRPPLQPEPE
jgi:hypothetical protein